MVKRFLKLVSVFGVFALLYIIPGFIRINKITCISQYGPCNLFLEEKLKGYEGKSYREVKRGIKKDLKGLVFVERYFLQDQIPRGIEVNVVQTKPKYALQYENEVYLINNAGIVTASSDTTGLPALKVKSIDKKIGDAIEPKLFFSLGIFNEVYEYYKVTSGSYSDDTLTIKIKDGPEVIFPNEGEREVLIGSLIVIMQQLNSGSEKFRIEKAKEDTTIDLRYKNP